jgi:hypothetical protein
VNLEAPPPSVHSLSVGVIVKTKRVAVAFQRFTSEFECSSTEVQLKKIADWKRAISTRQKEAGIREDDQEAQPHKDQQECDEEYLTWTADA